jgi:hypothetical protein
MSGDVFDGVALPGAPAHEFLMVVSHPCSMRRGAELIPRLQALPVSVFQDVPFTDWRDKFFRRFPLPALRSGDRPNFAADLTEIGMIPTEGLSLDHRVACLSEKGIVLGLQRLFHCMSRVKVDLNTLATHAQPPLEEAALLEEWNESLAPLQIESAEDRTVILAAEAVRFDGLMSTQVPGGTAPLRDGLAIPAERAGVRRRVREAIAELEDELRPPSQ